MAIQSKFTVTIDDKGTAFVSAVLINDIFKTIYRKSGSTQKKLISDLKLENYISIWRRHKDHTKVGSIATRILDQFKSQVHDLYLEVNELETPKEGANKQNHIELLRLIELLPDIEIDSESNDEPDVETKLPAIIESSVKSYDRVLMPIIQLEDHEMFRDANDQVFPIEVRGERSKDKILFKAKDVAAFADNERLIRTLLDDRKAYQYEIDYIILKIEGVRHWRTLDLPKNYDKYDRVNWDMVYLTTAGLIRVASVSRNANDNLIKLFDWLQNLFYVHQFGSYEERNELAQSLFKQVLNDKLAGLYCLSVGTFNDLYDSMNICRETYPPERYGKYQICKFGLSENIATRLTQHKNKKTGYGQWSSEIQFKWLILLSPSQLPKAEHILSNLLKAEGFTFDHSDDSKNHTELIMFDPVKEHKVKQIYRQVLDLYPSKENELSKALDDARTSFENKLNLVQANCTIEIMKATSDHAIQNAQRDNDLLKATTDNEMNQLKSTIQIQQLSHQNEMLQMQLKLAKLNLA